jgi:beta-lactamase regulating signal transducer with metallopeptidase domain
LLKLITPPLIPVPVLPSHPVESSVISSHGLQESPSSGVLQPLEGSRQDPGVPPIGHAEAIASRSLANSPTNSEVNAATEPDRVRWLVLLVWPSVCGTLILVVWNFVQMFRVSRLLGRATPGGQRLKQLVAQAGSWVGTKVVPETRVVDARVTPLLWARLRRPIIVLPRSLVDRLNDEQVSCIIRHEMAHYVRRDHWANAFGFAVAALFWWHPVVWWARREMQIAQELCCDALALSSSGANRRSYAETLFQTLEFVQAERRVATMLGVGFGLRHSITRRFEMIANASFKDRGSWWTYAVVLGVVMVLPCLPIQGKPASDAEQFTRQLPAKIAQLDIDSADREQVIEIFGQPEDYVWGDETYEPDDLPTTYIMRYPCGFRVYMSGGQIVEIRHERASKYVYRGKLRVGSTLDEALAVLGPPEETVSGEENEYKDRVLYKDIDGKKGHCYYLRTDQDVRLWFGNYKVAAIYMTRSDYGEEDDAERTPPQVAKTIEEARKNRPWIPKTTKLNADGRLRDKVDYPFVADADVVGTWKVVDFVRQKDDFVAGKQHWQGNLDFLKGMRFEKDGTVAVRIGDGDWRKDAAKWTKGMVLNEDTASDYEITRAKGKTFLFYQWKSGDYTIRYDKPSYYVLQKE